MSKLSVVCNVWQNLEDNYVKQVARNKANGLLDISKYDYLKRLLMYSESTDGISVLRESFSKESSGYDAAEESMYVELFDVLEQVYDKIKELEKRGAKVVVDDLDTFVYSVDDKKDDAIVLGDYEVVQSSRTVSSSILISAGHLLNSVVLNEDGSNSILNVSIHDPQYVCIRRESELIQFFQQVDDSTEYNKFKLDVYAFLVKSVIDGTIKEYLKNPMVFISTELVSVKNSGSICVAGKIYRDGVDKISYPRFKFTAFNRETRTVDLEYRAWKATEGTSAVNLIIL